MARGDNTTEGKMAVAEALRPKTTPAVVDADWWEPNAFYRLEAERFGGEYDIDPAVAVRLLKNDNLGWEQAALWFSPSGRVVISPEQTVEGMSGAAEELLATIRRGDKIALYSDYDPDGTCGAESLRLGLSPYLDDDDQLMIGYADAQSGFGLTSDFVHKAHKNGAKLLLTVDCGSGQSAQVALAQSLGMRVIVVDHHNADPDNPADFHLNPHLQEAELERPLREAEGVLRAANAAVAGIPERRRALKNELRRIQGSLEPEIQERAESLYAVYKHLGDELAQMDPELVAAEEQARKLYQKERREYEAALEASGGVSPNTGAPLAWKLASAVHIADQGRTRKEHWSRAMYLAGFGCRADMGSALSMEHRAFSWLPIDRDGIECVPPGIALLAERLGEDPLQPSGLMQTSACMNLPKRTTRVSAEQVGQMLRAQTREEAEPIVEDLLRSYEEAKPVRQRMAAEAAAQLDEQAERRVVVAIIDSDSEYAGYAGAVASSMSRSVKKPALIAVSKGKDNLGQEVYRFAMRNSAGIPHKIGDLRSEHAVLEACTLRRADESGVVIEAPSIGGHAQVVSGSVTKERLPDLVEAVENWAQSKVTWQKQAYNGPEAYVSERRVPAERFLRVEREAARLGPFSDEERHRPLQVSVVARASKPKLDEESGYYRTILTLAEGIERPAIIAHDRVKDLPKGEAEWVVQLGKPGDLYLRNWHVNPNGYDD